MELESIVVSRVNTMSDHIINKPRFAIFGLVEHRHHLHPVLGRVLINLSFQLRTLRGAVDEPATLSRNFSTDA